MYRTGALKMQVLKMTYRLAQHEDDVIIFATVLSANVSPFDSLTACLRLFCSAVHIHFFLEACGLTRTRHWTASVNSCHTK